ALKFPPVDENTYLSLSDTQYRLRQYQASAETLQQALGQFPDTGLLNAQLARSYARLDRESDAMSAIQKAEDASGSDYMILLATADELLLMGDRDQAMERSSRALDLSNSDRLHVRLALARFFAQSHKSEDAQQQIALAFAEARVSDPEVVT